MWHGEKCENRGDRPAGDEGFEPARDKVGAQTDIGEDDDPVHHEDNQRIDNDRKNISSLAFHCVM
jgi:hypothetical protein